MPGLDTAEASEAQPFSPSAARELVSRHALLLIVCVGAVIRFATLGTQSFWLDEAVTVEVIRHGPVELLEAVRDTESNPPPYYLLAAGWERVFGSGEVGLRSLSALLGTATIPVLYAAASALASRRAGLIAAALTATSPLLIWYSQEARNYELLIFLSALSFLFFARALQSEDRRWLWAWAGASALALSTHYFAIFLIVPEAAWLLRARRGSRLDAAFASAGIALVGLALLPLLLEQRGRVGWIESFSLDDRLAQVPAHFLVGFNAPWPVLPALVVGVVALTIAYGIVRVIRVEAMAQRAIEIAGSVVVVGLAIALVPLLLGEDYVVTRNLLELWPPFAVSLAVVLGARRLGGIGIATAVGVCIVGVALAVWGAVTPATQRADWSELAAELGQARQERVIVSQSNYSAPLTLYLDGARVPTSDQLAASELVVVERRPTENHAVGSCWWVATCGGTELFQGEPFQAPRGFRLKSTGSTPHFDVSVYTAQKPIEIQRPRGFLLPRLFVQAPL